MTEKKLSGIHEAIEKALYNRVDDVITYKVVPDKSNAERTKEIIQMQEKMLPLMSEELKELFDEYETLCGLDTSEQAKICYKQGLRDGIELSIEMDINKVCNDQQDIGNAGTLKEIID